MVAQLENQDLALPGCLTLELFDEQWPYRRASSGNCGWLEWPSERLGCRVERPARRVYGLTTLSDRPPAEQILEPAVLDERVALEIEEDVPGRGIRKARQAEVARLLIGSYLRCSATMIGSGSV